MQTFMPETAWEIIPLLHFKKNKLYMLTVLCRQAKQCSIILLDKGEEKE